MKNGSIIMIIEKTPSSSNDYYYQSKEQNSPNFNTKGKKHISYYDNFNYSFRSYDNNDDKYSNENYEITEDKNPCLIEKRKCIFYKKSKNIKEKEEKEEKIDKSPLKHSKTFSYTYSTPIKKKDNKENKFTNKDYNNIAIIHSKYSSKKDKNKTYNSNFSYGFIKSKSQNVNLNENEIINSDEKYDKYNKPRIEYSDDYIINKYSIEQFNNHAVLSNSLLKNNRAKTPIISMRDLGKKNQKKNNTNKELKKCLSKDNHRYYERKELSAPKKYDYNYIKMKSVDGNTVHVFENK